jgi:hypothetical protein
MPRKVQVEIPWNLARQIQQVAEEERVDGSFLLEAFLWWGIFCREKIIQAEKQAGNLMEVTPDDES